MAQQFIVEGKDGYVLSALCEKSGLGLPEGYNKRSYKNFVVKAGGISNIAEAIRTALQGSDVTNVGVVVDANDVGLGSRIDSVTNAIRAVVPGFTTLGAVSPQGWTVELPNGKTFGLWIMPDNESNGYLEHFLVKLISEDDSNYERAKQFLAQTLGDSDEVNFSEIRKQKALLALFFALQDEPGMSAQTAIAKGVLKHGHPLPKNILLGLGQHLS